VCLYGARSLMRGQICRLQLLMVLASAVILGSESRGTRDHILLSQIRDFLSVAFYEPQGYGGGVRPRLYTGLTRCLKLSSLYRHEPHRKHRFITLRLLLQRCVYLAVALQRKLLDCSLRIRCSGNVFTEPLPSNISLLWLHYSGFQAS
jgi:hypothetical protein